MVMKGAGVRGEKIKEKGVPVSHERGTGTFLVERSGGEDMTTLSGPSGIFPSLPQRAVNRHINLRPCIVKVLYG
jgi:hypothetical protein